MIVIPLLVTFVKRIVTKGHDQYQFQNQDKIQLHSFSCTVKLLNMHGFGRTKSSQSFLPYADLLGLETHCTNNTSWEEEILVVIS